MSNLQQHVLVVEDEEMIALSLCYQIEEFGYTVCGTAATAEEAIRLAGVHRPKVILMDVRLRGEGGDGVDAALAINKIAECRVIFLTGSKEPSTVARIHLDHPYAVLFKPVSYRQLQSAIDRAMNDGR